MSPSDPRRKKAYIGKKAYLGFMPQRTVNETFSEEEFARLQEVKGDRTWREFIIYAANRIALQDEAAKHIRVKEVERK